VWGKRSKHQFYHHYNQETTVKARYNMRGRRQWTGMGTANTNPKLLYQGWWLITTADAKNGSLQQGKARQGKARKSSLCKLSVPELPQLQEFSWDNRSQHLNTKFVTMANNCLHFRTKHVMLVNDYLSFHTKYVTLANYCFSLTHKMHYTG
jgi:hypothetical protein